MSRKEFLDNVNEINKEIEKIHELDARLDGNMPKIRGLSDSLVDYEEFIKYVENYFENKNKEKGENKDLSEITTSTAAPVSNSGTVVNSK